ncbi:MAG: RecX family transcriptional regulator [Anaerolineales bacterium]|nr:RecX family transcriptional regulator [Anaerolineales bacterium]MCA9931052.1 RecX family transcriptional regulator [Anaerolineales bacterium]
MQRVTALTRQKRNPDRINVFLDETFAFGLAEIAAARLQIGQMLSPEEIAELKRQDSFEKAKQSAFKLISYRPRSVAEVARNLREKSYDEAVVSEVIARMQELQLLDDHAFALYWIEQRETFKPRSFMALRQELMQKGISRDIIDEALANVDETAVAHKAAAKRIARWQHLPADQLRDKMGGYLQRRGFGYGIIREVIDEIIENLSHEHGN